MYDDVLMHRTQIYLGDEERELLDRAQQRSGASRSELIRRAIRASYGARDAGQRRDALAESFGAWRGREADGAAHVDALRGDLDERLDRLGLS